MISITHMIENREEQYLRYRFGFDDDTEYSLTETAMHFHLSESRAKSTEALALDNVWLELPVVLGTRGTRRCGGFIYLLLPL